MAKHFLKSAAVRDFTMMHVINMSEEECYELFKTMKWGDDGTQICSHCGVIDRHYFRKGRKQWRCKHCDEYFSVTTGTALQDRKLPFKTILLFIMKFIGSAAGSSYHEFSRELNIEIKTAQALIGKIREVIIKSQDKKPMTGLVQMDGGYFGGRPRNGRLRRKKDPIAVANYVESKLKKEDPKQRRPSSPNAYRNWKRHENKRIVMAVRECHPEKGTGGGIRTLIGICYTENEKEATELAKAYVKSGTHIMTDDCPAYNALGKDYFHESVQHAVEFSTENGVNDNHAESYFSRLRRNIKGVGLRCTPKYLYDLATEIAWREDTRRWTSRQKLEYLMKNILTKKLSQWWRGYWQGYHRKGELLWADSKDNVFKS